MNPILKALLKLHNIDKQKKMKYTLHSNFCGWTCYSVVDTKAFILHLNIVLRLSFLPQEIHDGIPYPFDYDYFLFRSSQHGHNRNVVGYERYFHWRKLGLERWVAAHLS